MMTDTEHVENFKKKKSGIIYLSTIPKYMNITKVREIFSTYGKVGRVYLQLAENMEVVKKRKPVKHFTEGWVEFESKKVAKYVAAVLNNKQISMRKKSKFFDVIWNIKYLPRFKWIHLSERLAYERAVYKQRLHTEIAQAKRETNYISYNIDRSKRLIKKKLKGEATNFVLPKIKQRETDAEIRNMKGETEIKNRDEILKSLFG
ncbi:activator of basal transcription 1-like [Vespa crabro]|uniref:activator of basal transcription 1-like n=1 Tax=Vespa crabro TaxID=7445 RepID=UPI001F00320D|nr:activator of basal transcription 1-like [Vespa crabro]XP_046831851.1 activator of basal transcription 1-like [Vespa crabro]